VVTLDSPVRTQCNGQLAFSSSSTPGKEFSSANHMGEELHRCESTMSSLSFTNSVVPEMEVTLLRFH
jgi:hypothetical protein